MSNSHDVADLPDDFFNDLADERFIDEVMDHGNDSDEDISHYVAEITKLQKDIEIRKKKIKTAEASLTKRRRSHSRSISPHSKTRKHREREKDSKRRRTRSRSRSQEVRHSRHDERIREKRYPLSPVRRPGRGLSPPQRGRTSRRSRSNSPQNSRKRSSSTHKNISFLEELAQKFAEQGRAFPEKDALLMGQNHMNNADGAMLMNAYGNQMPFGDQQMIQPTLMNLPNYIAPQIGFAGQTNSYYGINPMSILAGNPIPPPATNMANLPFLPGANIGQQNEMQLNLGNSQVMSQTTEPISKQQKALIDRCDQAIKLIRAKENKVPIMKCTYNRTSLVSSNSYDLSSSAVNKSPLNAHSTLNTSFKLNAPPNLYIKTDGLKVLPKRVRDAAVALGINSPFLFEKMRKKELNAQITSDIYADIENVASIGEILVQATTVPVPEVETNSIAIQAEFNCEKCVERDCRMMVNAPTQTTLKSISIGVQTNEKDYREPIVELLSRMTAAQLVAIKDFANIVDEPRPRDHEEMFKIRERLMDIYSLSQRDADTVRAAEDNSSRMDGGQFIDNLRFTGNRDQRDIDVYSEGNSRDFIRGTNSPFNGNNIMERASSGNFMSNTQWDKSNSRGYERRRTPQEEEEMERCRYLELEQKRLEDLEMQQKIYEEERLEREREQRRMRMEQMDTNFQRPNQTVSFDDEGRFNREPDDRESQRGKPFNSNRGGGTPNNRRGRGAFRDNFRGGRGNRRLI